MFNIMAAKLIGIEGYGTYVFISSTVMLISIVIKMGIDQGITVLVPREDYQAEKSHIITAGLLMMYAVIIILLSIVLLFSKNIASDILNTPEYSQYLTYYAPILLIIPMTQVSEGIFRSVYKIRHYVIGKSVLMPIGIICSFLILYFVMEMNGLLSLFVCNYIGFGLGAIYMVWHMQRDKLIAISRKGISQRMRQLFILSLPLVFLGMHEYLIGRTDAFIIGYYMDEGKVGVFNIADKVAYISSFILIAAGSIVAPPEISKHYNVQAIEKLKHVYHESTKLLVMVNTSVFFCVVIYARWFMDFATGGDYNGWMLLIVLSFAYLIHSLFGPVAYMNSMTENHFKEFKITLLMIGSNVILDIVLIRYIGIIGIAIGTVVVLFLGNLYRTREMFQKMSILPSLKNLFIPVIGLFTYLIIWLAVGSLGIDLTFVGLTIEALCFFLTYVIVVYILMVTREEKALLSTWITKRH